MSIRQQLAVLGTFGFLAALAAVGATRVLAHCDGLDGPVVQAAKRALDSGNVNLALVWVQAADEAEIRTAFQQAVSVRKLSATAGALADRYFFETLVRLHRAGEGAPYTGLKPAGRDLGLAIPAADKAVLDRKTAALEKLLIDEIRQGVRAHFREVQARRDYNPNDLTRGREYVKAYVEFIHYVERLHESAAGSASGHFEETHSAR
jgi:hypothetical protein